MPYLVRVQVMRIGHMGMNVANGFMAMFVAMFSNWFAFMAVQMVAIVVRVGMFMFDRFMNMLMAMRFHQMQEDTNQHQDSTNDEHPAACAVAHRKCA